MIVVLSFFAFVVALVGVYFVFTTYGQILLDVPNERSSHTKVTPRGGGLGFLFAFFLMSLIGYFVGLPSQVFTPLFWLMVFPLLLIGLLDDRYSLSAAVRYTVQLAISVAVVWHLDVFQFPVLNQYAWAMPLSFLLTVIGTTAIINFYNFMDGIDGLVAGVSAIQLGFLAVWFQQEQWWLLVAAILAFLFWNWSPARVFMGDAGSTFLGMAIMTAFLAHSGSVLEQWMALVITFPLTLDAVYTIIRRKLNGENIFKPHRSHLYQRLVQAGFSHARITSNYMLLTATIGLLITYFAVWGAVLATLLTLLAIAVAESHLKSYQAKNNEPVLK